MLAAWKKLKTVVNFESISKITTTFYHKMIQKLYVVIMSRTNFRVNLHSTVCLNVNELLARSRHHIWSLSDSNGIRTRNHLVPKRILNGCKLSGCGFESRCCHLKIQKLFALLWLCTFAKYLQIDVKILFGNNYVKQ